MSFFEWGPQLALGVTRMDSEHKELIHFMNRLHDAKAS